MDRPEKHVTRTLISLIVAVLLGGSALAAPQSDPLPEPAAAPTAAPTPAPKKQSKAEPQKKAPSFAGIFYGHLIDVQSDRSAITVKPIDKSQSRKRFYLDKSSQVFVDGKRAKPADFYFGDKVAVRYFGLGPYLVADGIYVVFGEFQPKNYIVKKKAVVVKLGEDKAKGEGGHGEKKGEKKEEAPKKPAAKGGGHH